LFQRAKSHEGNPSNQKTKNNQPAEADPTKLTQEGDGDVFSMTMAQILVPHLQPGHRRIHLTSNPGMTSASQKELFHCDGLHCNATSLLWQFL
jgi:hypothetical protein